MMMKAAVAIALAASLVSLGLEIESRVRSDPKQPERIVLRDGSMETTVTPASIQIGGPEGKLRISHSSIILYDEKGEPLAVLHNLPPRGDVRRCGALALTDRAGNVEALGGCPLGPEQPSERGE